MKITVLGAHVTESRDTKSTSLLIDDILAVDGGGLTSTLTFEEQLKIRAILLTHRHYDHIKDIVSLAIFYDTVGKGFRLYSTNETGVENALRTHLLGRRMMESSTGSPTVRFTALEPLKASEIEGYSVMAVPVNHRTPAVGYEVASLDGKKMFYTSDTTAGLTDCWKSIAPDLLLIEATLPNRQLAKAHDLGHMTPSLILQELTSFRSLKGYLPQIVVIHMEHLFESEIRAELKDVSQVLNHPIAIGYEGMQILI